MRRITMTVLAGSLLFFGFGAGQSAQAIPLQVDTDPVPYAGFLEADDKFVSGEVDILSITSDRLELQVFADQLTFKRDSNRNGHL